MINNKRRNGGRVGRKQYERRKTQGRKRSAERRAFSIPVFVGQSGLL